MARPKADFLIPRLNPALSPDRLEKILSEEEIRIIQYIDGETSCSLLARLLGYSGDSLQAILDTLSNRGVVQLGYRTTDELHFDDFEESLEFFPAKQRGEMVTPPSGIEIVTEGEVTIHSIPTSLLQDLSPAIAEQSLSPGEIRLLVFIDGGTSIQNLATLIGSSPEEVLESTRKLEQQGFISFGGKPTKPLSEMSSPGFGSIPTSVQQALASFTSGEDSSSQYDSFSEETEMGIAFSEDTSLDPSASLLNPESFRQELLSAEPDLGFEEDDELELELEDDDESDGSQALVFSNDFGVEEELLEDPLMPELEGSSGSGVMTFSSAEFSNPLHHGDVSVSGMPTLPPMASEEELDELSLPIEESFETTRPGFESSESIQVPHASLSDIASYSPQEALLQDESDAFSAPLSPSQSLLAASQQHPGNVETQGVSSFREAVEESIVAQEHSQVERGREQSWQSSSSQDWEAASESSGFASMASMEDTLNNLQGNSVFFTSSDDEWSMVGDEDEISLEEEASELHGTGAQAPLPPLPSMPPSITMPPDVGFSMPAAAEPVLPPPIPSLPPSVSTQRGTPEEELTEEELEELAKKKALEEAEARDFMEWFSSVDIDEELDSEVSKQVANIMVALARVTNSLLFYDPRNKAVRNALANFYARISAFLKNNNELRLNVEPWDIQHEGEVVYRNRDREQSLAYKLFRDGVRGVIFREGINWSELSRFLKILGVRYNGVHLFEEDIVTMLWKESFQSIEILAVEGTDLREEKAPLMEFAEELFSEVFDAADADRQQENYFYLPQLLQEESPYLLLQHLQPRGYGYTSIPETVTERLKQEFDIKHLSDRVFRLLDYLELECLDPEHPWQGIELSDLLAEFRDFLMADGLLEELYHLLMRVSEWYRRSSHDPMYKQLSKLAGELLADFEDERIMKRFLDSLSLREEGHIPERAHQILDILAFDKVPLFLQLLKESKTRHLRDVLIDLLLKVTNNNENLFIGLLPKAETELRMAILRCLQGLRSEKAVVAIVAELGHPDPDVRRLVVQIIDELITEKNAGATVYKVITQLIDDPESRIRNRAYKLIQLSRDKRWTRTLLRLVQSEGATDHDEMVRIARLVAWLSPEEAEPVLLEMAKPPGFFTLDTGTKREQQRIAINALGMIRSEKAEEMVKLVRQKMSNELELECIEALREMRREDRDEAILRTLVVEEIDSLMSLDAVPAVSEEEEEEGTKEIPAHVDEVEQMSEEEADKAFMQDLEDSDLKEVDVQNIQMQLMRELTQAGADNEQTNVYHSQLRRYGQRLVQMFHMLIVSSRLYSQNNRVFEKPLDDLAEIMLELNRLVVEFSLTWIEGQFYLNETRIRMRGENALVAEALFRELDSMGLGGFTFSVPMRSEQLLPFVTLMSGTSMHGRSTSLEDFRTAVQNERLDSYITVTGRLAYRLLEENQEVTTANLVSNYAKGIRAADSLWTSASSGRLPNPVPVRRCINDFVDALVENDQSTLEVIALEDNANPLQAHFLRVALYSVMIGMELDLPSTTLSDLGLAAFFHDVGYACSEEVLAATALQAQSSDEEEEAEATDTGEETTEDQHFLDTFEEERATPEHPLEHHRKGLRLLVKQRGFHDAKIKRLLAVYEHHLPFRHQFGYVPNLFSRIIRVADVFDTLTSNILPQPLVSPDRALGILMAGAGSHFDQAAVQALINRLGRFPLGSILELSDGSLCISMGYDGNPVRFDRPQALLYRSARGRVAEGQIISLADEDFQHLQIVGVHKDTPEINARHTLATTLKQRLQVEKLLRLSEAGMNAYGDY